MKNSTKYKIIQWVTKVLGYSLQDFPYGTQTCKIIQVEVYEEYIPNDDVTSSSNSDKYLIRKLADVLYFQNLIIFSNEDVFQIPKKIRRIAKLEVIKR